MAEEKRPAAGTERGRGRPKQVRVRCPHCQGTGKDIVKIAGKTKPTIKECPVCHGSGYLVKEGQQNENMDIEHLLLKRKSYRYAVQHVTHYEELLKCNDLPDEYRVMMEGYRDGQVRRDVFKDWVIREQPALLRIISFEQAPTNSMGTSSSVQGTGNISTFDTLLGNKPIKRKMKNSRQRSIGAIPQIG